jgi:hypothetical protein
MEPTREERSILLALVLPKPIPHSIGLDDSAGVRTQNGAVGVIPGRAGYYVPIFAAGSDGGKKDAYQRN